MMTIGPTSLRALVASLIVAGNLTVLAPQPSVSVTHVPACGRTDEVLRGRTGNVSPRSHRVVVYVRVPYAHPGGRPLWWGAKPFYGSQNTIAADGRFRVDVDTGGNDEDATRIAVFVVPARYRPPDARGTSALPNEVAATAVARIGVRRCR
jgi:hypothetical protein